MMAVRGDFQFREVSRGRSRILFASVQRYYCDISIYRDLYILFAGFTPHRVFDIRRISSLISGSLIKISRKQILPLDIGHHMFDRSYRRGERGVNKTFGCGIARSYS